jgi:hypothetical protein
MALAGVFQVIIGEASNRGRKGHSQPKIADVLYPIGADADTEGPTGPPGGGTPSDLDPAGSD